MTGIQEAPAQNKTALAKIRTDVVGSLLRPEIVKEARIAFDDGKITADALHAIEDEAVVEAVRLQEERGSTWSPMANRRLNFQDSFGASVEGYDANQSKLKVYEQRVDGAEPGQRWEIRKWTCRHGGVASSSGQSAIEARAKYSARGISLRRKVAKKPAKVSLIGPDRISQRFEYQKSTNIYPTWTHSSPTWSRSSGRSSRASSMPAAAISKSTRPA